MKKIIILFSVFIQLTSSISGFVASPPQDVYQQAVTSGNVVFTATWPYEFTEKENLYSSLLNIDMNNKKKVRQRYKRMLHIPYLTKKQVNNMIDRVEKFAEHVPQLASHIQNKIMNLYFDKDLQVQHISIYGSYLYNGIDPDDVDLMVVVDSKASIFQRIELSAIEVLGWQGAHLPRISFEVMDYATYLKAKDQIKSKSPQLTTGEKIALQQLTLASKQYFTIFGFDLRYDSPKSLKGHMKLNYLNKAFNTLNGAGARLYKGPFSHLPQESDLARLRKVVSRLLITDYIISVLKREQAEPIQTFNDLYDQIRGTSDHEFNKIEGMRLSIEKLYLKKLKQLLFLADEMGVLNKLTSKNY